MLELVVNSADQLTYSYKVAIFQFQYVCRNNFQTRLVCVATSLVFVLDLVNWSSHCNIEQTASDPMIEGNGKKETASFSSPNDTNINTLVAPELEVEKPPGPPPPPNGGLTAWLQVVGGFIIFFNTWGLINTFAVFQTYYESAGFFLPSLPPTSPGSAASSASSFS